MRALNVFAVMLITAVVVSGCAATKSQKSKPLVTEDQTKLEFDYFPAELPNSPAVILLPDTRSDRKIFGNIPGALKKAGFGVLAMDFRYKDLIARAGGREQAIQIIKKQDLEVLVNQDVKSALDFLSREEAVNPNRIGLVGTSLGARVGLKAGVKYSVEALVLVSLSGKEVFTEGSTPIRELLKEYGEKPILFMTAKKDWGNNFMAAEDNRSYVKWTGGPSDLKIWPGSGHGVDILKKDGAKEFLISWLKQNL